jgi:RsfA family transcription factor
MDKQSFTFGGVPMDKAVGKKKNWTSEEEKTLTDTVVKVLQDGRTQKEAFEEAAHIIGRTPGACSFRWNNKLKKKMTLEEDNNLSSPPSLEDCIAFLQTLSFESNLLSENNKLKESQQELKKTLQTAEKNFLELKLKYKELLSRIDENELTAVLQITN